MPTLDATTPDTSWLGRAVEILKGGGLVAFPTETVYGLGARALDPQALNRIFQAKGRPATHPLIAHVLGVTEARTLTRAWPDVAERFAARFWPGPLTIVLPRAPHVPRELSGGGDTVAVRAPSHPVARALLLAMNEPLAAPSANRYQSVSPTTAAHVERSLGSQVDLIVDGGPCTSGIESTVLDLSGAAPVVLRPGGLDLPTLQSVEPRTRIASETVLALDAVHPSPGMDKRHYSPRAPLLIAASRDAALAEARARTLLGESIALVLVSPLPAGSDISGPLVFALGPSRESYARGLYAALHTCNEVELSAILVEPVPDAPAWAAIADRLERARGG